MCAGSCLFSNTELSLVFFTTSNPLPCLFNERHLRPQIVTEQQSHLLSCGLWINLDIYSSDLTRQKLPFSEFVLLDSFLTHMRFQQAEHTWRALQLPLVAVRAKDVSISVSLRCWPAHRQVCLLLTQWDSKETVSEAPEGRFTTWNAPLTQEKCVFLALCVCALMRVFSLFLSGERSHSLYFLSAPLLAEAQRAVMKASVTAWLGMLIFPPCCAPRRATLLH